MKRIKLVSHSWLYSRCLTYQLSSVLLNPPHDDNHLTVTICYSLQDPKTAKVLEWFCKQDKPHNVIINGYLMATERLMRRAIGRHELCKATYADFVLLSDVDMLFGPGAIDGIVSAWPDGGDLCYPRIVGKCPHERGDQYIEAVTEPGLYDINPGDFIPTKYNRAIGGVQWVLGDVARERGYLPEGSKWLRPEWVWKKTNEDRPARKHMAGHKGIGIDVPNVFRIRHSQWGRTHVGVEN